MLFDETKVRLNEIFDTGHDDWRQRATLRKIAGLKFERATSKADLEALVSTLAGKRYGNERRFRDLYDPAAEGFLRRVLIAQQKEIATRGLVAFYESRGLLKETPSLKLQVRKLIASRTVQILLSTASLISTVRGPVPTLVAPTLSLFKIRPDQFETLILRGTESAEGKAVLTELLPLHQNDLRVQLLTRTFNRISYLVSMYFLFTTLDELNERLAQENGERMMQAFAEQAARLAAEPEILETKNDILFDETVKLLESDFKRPLNAAEKSEVCLKIAAAHRCG